MLVGEASKPPLLSFPTGSTLGIFLSRSSLLSVIPWPKARFHLCVLWAVEKDGETRKRLERSCSCVPAVPVGFASAKKGTKSVHCDQHHRRASSHRRMFVNQLCPYRPTSLWVVGITVFFNLCGMVTHTAVSGTVCSPFEELLFGFFPGLKRLTSTSWTSRFPPGQKYRTPGNLNLLEKGRAPVLLNLSVWRELEGEFLSEAR